MPIVDFIFQRSQTHILITSKPYGCISNRLIYPFICPLLLQYPQGNHWPTKCIHLSAQSPPLHPRNVTFFAPFMDHTLIYAYWLMTKAENLDSIDKILAVGGIFVPAMDDT